MNTEIDTPTHAVAIREPITDPPITSTPAQAKIDAIAALTMSAYSRASQLMLTDEEIAALTADFPDEAFKPGAAGKENLIYIEHAFLRDRLNAVFRPGQWAIVPRNRWAEEFKTQKGVDGSRVYVEAMLCIRGCFAAESVGEMEYYPTNGSQNYGDCVEGAKTAALRRCCKEVGIGLQAWKKDWCDGWWQRRRNGARPQAATSTPPAPKNAAAAPQKPKEELRQATEATKAWMFKELACYDESTLLDYACKHNILLPSESLDDWPLTEVPTDKESLWKLIRDIEVFRDGGAPPEDNLPYDPEEWRSFPMPFGKHAGAKMEDLEKKYLFGLWANYTVEKEYNGKPKSDKQIQKDRQLRAYLDDAGKHYEFTKQD